MSSWAYHFSSIISFRKPELLRICPILLCNLRSINNQKVTKFQGWHLKTKKVSKYSCLVWTLSTNDLCNMTVDKTNLYILDTTRSEWDGHIFRSLSLQLYWPWDFLQHEPSRHHLRRYWTTLKMGITLCTMHRLPVHSHKRCKTKSQSNMAKAALNAPHTLHVKDSVAVPEICRQLQI